MWLKAATERRCSGRLGWWSGRVAPTFIRTTGMRPCAAMLSMAVAIYPSPAESRTALSSVAVDGRLFCDEPS